MKTFQILPWYLLLLLVGLCVAVMWVQEGYTEHTVIVVKERELTDDSDFTKNLKNKDKDAVIVMSHELQGIFNVKKRFKKAEYYILPSTKLNDYIKTTLCFNFNPEVGAPFIFKKNNNYAVNNTSNIQPYNQVTNSSVPEPAPQPQPQPEPASAATTSSVPASVSATAPAPAPAPQPQPAPAAVTEPAPAQQQQNSQPASV